MKYSMKLLEKNFNEILSGRKTIEIRLFDEKRKKLRLGDIIEFYKLPDLNDKLNAKIIALLKYNSFRELLIDFKEYCGVFENSSINLLLDDIYKIYSHEKEQKYGVLGIKIKLLEDCFS